MDKKENVKSFVVAVDIRFCPYGSRALSEDRYFWSGVEDINSLDWLVKVIPDCISWFVSMYCQPLTLNSLQIGWIWVYYPPKASALQEVDYIEEADSGQVASDGIRLFSTTYTTTTIVCDDWWSPTEPVDTEPEEGD